jgi:hypothetical protein
MIQKNKRIGIIGLDAMHAVALTRAINSASATKDYLGYHVTMAYPQGSKTLEYRKARIPEYIRAVEEMGVETVNSIDGLLQQVDQVMLTSNDGHVHLEQALPVIKAGKPLFIDKPLAGSWEDAVAIYQAAKKYRTPVFSSSSLRFISGIQQLDKSRTGVVLGAHTFSPATFEPSLPELLWYAIHGIEMLFAIMGTGCLSVQRTFTENYDYVTGVWEGGRIGTYRGTRKGKAGFGGIVFGQNENIVLGTFEGYEPLALAIVHFFETRVSPVKPEETLEIIAFIFAAEESKKQGGVKVSLNSYTRQITGIE